MSLLHMHEQMMAQIVVGVWGRKELCPEMNSDHPPSRIWITSLENSAHSPGEFGLILGEYGLLFNIFK